MSLFITLVAIDAGKVVIRVVPDCLVTGSAALKFD
jgi:hypothetical protein